MNDSPLVLPRRVAVRIMGEAQSAQPRRIGGVVGYDDTGPAVFLTIRNASGQPETSVHHAGDDVSLAKAGIDGRGMGVWAYVVSNPTAAAAEPGARDFVDSPFPDARQLVVSLSTKGVLEIRCWERSGATVRERVLKIRD
jgi:[CysO sulfur-carrier protein]-S-L-cysteine hydrolase